MKKKLTTLVVAGVMCVSSLISTFAATNINTQTGVIPGTDTQYEYVENVTVKIPETEVTYDLEGVSAQVGLLEDDEGIPIYRFAFVGESGKITFNNEGLYWWYMYEDITVFESGGGNATTAVGDVASFEGNDGIEKKVLSYRGYILADGTITDDPEYSNSEAVARVEFIMGKAGGNGHYELPDDLISYQGGFGSGDPVLADVEKINISTLAVVEDVETEYTILDGADSVWNESSDSLTIKADGEFSKFTGVKVDGVLVDNNNYTAKEGSTIVEFKADYLNTLEKGKHSVTIIFEDGEVTTNFEIEKVNASVNDVIIPNTNAQASVKVAAVAMLFASAAGATVFIRKKRA